MIVYVVREKVDKIESYQVTEVHADRYFLDSSTRKVEFELDKHQVPAITEAFKVNCSQTLVGAIIMLQRRFGEYIDNVEHEIDCLMERVDVLNTARNDLNKLGMLLLLGAYIQ